jgi:methylated-DNA-[protein]-cysteine S-methyltransferase
MMDPMEALHVVSQWGREGATMKDPVVVSVDSIESDQVGEVWFAVGPNGLWRLSFGTTRERFLNDLADDHVVPVEDAAMANPFKKQLADYFAGRLKKWDMKIDWSRLEGFSKKALQVCAKIPYGKTLSYGEVAARAGAPGAARAAGSAMGSNPFAIIVPCHRVIAAGNKIGGYGRSPEAVPMKRRLLRMEGVEI